MLKKEALFGVNNKNSHIIMHISKIDEPIGDIDFYSVGWKANEFGKVNRIPFWYTGSGIIELHGIYGKGSFDLPPSQTYIISNTKLKDFKDLIITVENNSVNAKLVGRTTTSIENDPLNLYGNRNKEVVVTFDPPTDTSIRTPCNLCNSSEASMEESVDVEHGIVTNSTSESRDIANRRGIRRRIRTSLLQRRHKERLLWFRYLGISKRPDYVCYSTYSYNNKKYDTGFKDWGLDCGRYIQRCLPRVRHSILKQKEALYV